MKIVGVAFQLGEVTISLPAPARHSDIFKALPFSFANKNARLFTQGFITDEAVFLDRKAARDLALNNGQMLDPAKSHKVDLFSEDLW